MEGGPVILRAAVDRTPELLNWAEQRAATYGITPPYLLAGFAPQSVAPQASSSSAAPSSSVDAATAEEEFELPPLAAVSHSADNGDSDDGIDGDIDGRSSVLSGTGNL